MTKEAKTDFIVGLIGLSLGIAGFFLKLFVITKLWTLIAVPMGAPSIDQWQAYGIVLIAGLALSDVVMNKQDREGKSSERLMRLGVASIIAPLFTWGIASLIF